MDLTIGPRPTVAGDFHASQDHARQCRAFAQIIGSDPRLRGRVLDVGCGVSGPTIPHYHDMYRLPAQLDGLDPMPGVEANEWVHRCWHGIFEQCPVPENEYDAIICINVAEHVADPEGFLRTALKVLRPGGAIFATTPNGFHPFPVCVRLVQALGLKSRMVAGHTGWNDYPAYYRLNTRAALRRNAERTGFAKAEVHYYPNLQWWQYWPRQLRFVPAAFDWLVGCRWTPMFQQMLWRLEKPGAWAGPRTDRTPSNKPSREAATAPAA